jgi:hypothetical protein
MMNTVNKPLGVGIVLFIVFELCSVLSNLGFVVFAALWAVPRISAIQGGRELMGDILADQVQAGVVAVLSSVGIVLIIRRHRWVRRYWLGYLALYALVRLSDLLTGREFEGPAFSAVAALCWLAYWAKARRPRELPLERVWLHPAHGEARSA